MADETTSPHRKSGSSLERLIGALAVVFLIIAIALGLKLHTAKNDIEGMEAQRDQAKAETVQVQGQLDSAKTASAQLQAQLDQAKAAGARLQEQSNQLTAERDQTRKQLDQAKADSAQVQAQLDQAKSEATQAQSQIDQAKAQSAQLQSQLTDANSKVSALQSQANDNRDKIVRLESLATAEKPMPISTVIKQRKMFFFFGRTDYILRISNTSAQPLNLSVAITSSAAPPRSETERIDPGATVKIGSLAAGDNVEITGPDYPSTKLVVQ